ncbi:MAG TPA: hypothetical protein VHC90_00580 [Bryobacteraceae bacterium]|nr:hypothetical protein [Bryobacteraceae bacterium]
MKKAIYTLITFAAFAASAFAMQEALAVKVPFAFKAGTTTLPAGDYRITEASPGVLLIRGEKTAVFVPRAVLFGDPAETGKARVTFTRTGDHYVLENAGTPK